jgi:hypothetical protein
MPEKDRNNQNQRFRLKPDEIDIIMRHRFNSDDFENLLSGWWKFKDENGNLWNTETAIDGTEEEAASIILHSMNQDNV